MWRSLHIRRRISGPVGEQTCIQGPALPGSHDRRLGMEGRTDRRHSLQTAPRVAVKLAGDRYPLRWESSHHGRREPAWSLEPGSRGGTDGPIYSPDDRLDQWSRLAAPFPEGGRSTSRTGSLSAARSVRSPKTLCIAGDIKISLYEWRPIWRMRRHWWERCARRGKRPGCGCSRCSPRASTRSRI